MCIVVDRIGLENLENYSEVERDYELVTRKVARGFKKVSGKFEKWQAES